MSFRKAIIAASLTLALMGCAVGPNYRQPAITLPDHWQTQQTGQLVALQDWWGQFNDPVLSQLQNVAQASSPSLAKATAAIDKARASRSASGAGLWPSLTGNGSATESGSLNHDDGITRKTSAALDASWELDLFGKTHRSMESADALIQARQADWHDARISLAAEVAGDYVDYRACQIKQRYYEAQVSSQATTTALTQLSAQAGFTATADARLAQGSLASTRATALAQKTECEVLVKTLVAVTGMAESDLRVLLRQEDTRLPTPSGLTVQTVPAELLRQRPDIVAAERNLASTSALIGVAEAARWPSLSLSGSVGLTKTQGTSLSAPWSFGPGLSLPIFDGGSIAANIRSAQADYASALASYQQTVRTAVQEVEQALTRLDSLAEREDALRESAAGYRASLTATESLARAGGASQLSLETTRRNAIAADISLLELQQSRLTYWIALYKAVGGGWQAPQGESK